MSATLRALGVLAYDALDALVTLGDGALQRLGRRVAGSDFDEDEAEQFLGEFTPGVVVSNTAVLDKISDRDLAWMRRQQQAQSAAAVSPSELTLKRIAAMRADFMASGSGAYSVSGAAGGEVAAPAARVGTTSPGADAGQLPEAVDHNDRTSVLLTAAANQLNLWLTAPVSGMHLLRADYLGELIPELRDRAAQFQALQD